MDYRLLDTMFLRSICPITGNRTCGPHGPETAFLEMKQCVDALSSERLSCNTAGIRSFEPLVPPLRLLLPPFAASTNR